MTEQHPVSDDPLSPTNSGEKEMSVRHAPRVWPFLIAGALVGVIAAIITVAVGEPPEDYGTGGAMGYFAIVFGIIGVGLAGILFLILDRRSLKKATAVTAVPVPEVTVDSGTTQQQDPAVQQNPADVKE